MATTAAKHKLVVCGGNGFLGSRICKAAVARGWNVTSISRSGEPKWSSVTSSDKAPHWSRQVSWQRADLLSPSTYITYLSSADSVVHSMGILLEADYKGALTGQVSPIAGLQRAFSSTKAGTQNPLQRKDNEDLKPQEKDGQLTYEVMNRDSAIALAQEAQKAGAKDFVYISASAGAPVLPTRYITTKRQAEESIATLFPKLRSIFIRPGMLYDSSRSITMAFAGMTALGSMANNLTGGRLSSIMGAAGSKPLKADVVAEAVIEAIDDKSANGVIEVPEIELLATTAWRKGML